jgi:hypothetical protein
MSTFKAILVIIGLIFFAEQASFKFYRFASYPSCGSVAKVVLHPSISTGTADYLNNKKQAKINLLLDKRYDLKHVFITPVPLHRLAILPLQSYKPLYILLAAFAAGASQVISMRGPPSH